MITIAHPKPSSLTYLTMPAGSKYLSDKLPDTLPQNCLFDKVLTGCGGTFVALASYQPYIVAVPTKALGDPLSLGKLKGDAPDLSDETAELFKKKSVGLKVICKLYEEDPKACKDKYPDWYDIIESLGVEAIAKASYFKRKVKKMAEAKVTIERPSIQQQVFNAFKVGECYSSSYIRSVLEKIEGIHSRKATALRVWFQMEAFMKNNRTHYHIIRKL